MWVLFLGWEDSPGVGNGKALQYSCLENPMDRDPGRLEAAQGAPRDPRRDSRRERSPWLPLETRAQSRTPLHHTHGDLTSLAPHERLSEFPVVPGDLPDPGSNPRLLCLLHWQVGSLPLGPPRKSSVQPTRVSWSPLSGLKFQAPPGSQASSRGKNSHPMGRRSINTFSKISIIKM